jgi:hypothetical protein
MVEDSVETLNAWDGNTSFLSELQGRTEVGFYLHRTFGLKVEPHGAVVLLWLQHSLQSRFPEVGGENALLCFGERKQLIQDTGNKSANADLLDKLGVVWLFKKNTGRVERDWTTVR